MEKWFNFNMLRISTKLFFIFRDIFCIDGEEEKSYDDPEEYLDDVEFETDLLYVEELISEVRV